MKKALFLLSILFSLTTFAKWEHTEGTSDKANIYNPYRRTSSEKLKNLTKNEAIYKFEFIDFWGDQTYTVKYSIDGLENEQQLKRNELLSIKTTPGKHIFQFYVGNNYEELQTDSILIEAQHCDKYLINLQQHNLNDGEIMVYKPVIYLYPKETTDVTVKVDTWNRSIFVSCLQ